MPPALQTTSRSQCAPIFLEAGIVLEIIARRKRRSYSSKEIPCAANPAAAPVAHAGAESLCQLGRCGGFQLRFIF